MVRTPGARDKHKRKRRRDAKYKKHRRISHTTGEKYYVPYSSKRKRGDPVRVWFWEKTPMTMDGYHNWNRKIRSKLSPYVFRFIDKPFHVDGSRLANPDAIGSLAVGFIQYPGTFYLMMPGHAKNRGHSSYYKKAVITISENPETGELHAKVSNYWKLSRYWFWEGSG